MAAKRKTGKTQVEEQLSLKASLPPEEIVFGVCHIYASFNDTFVHVTDSTCSETIIRVTGGMKVRADRDESSPYAAMLAAQDVAERCKLLGIGALHVRIRATGGTRYVFILSLIVFCLGLVPQALLPSLLCVPWLVQE